jgi:hypothetical protein
MAKAKAAGESKSALFKRLFQSNKDLLKVPSIDDVIKMFEAETGRSATDKDRGVAANVKSKLRKQLGMRGRRGRRGRNPGRPAGAQGTPVMAAARKVKNTLALEDAIEDCIYLARRMESDRLVDVIRDLRRARNHLILMSAAK